MGEQTISIPLATDRDRMTVIATVIRDFSAAITTHSWWHGGTEWACCSQQGSGEHGCRRGGDRVSGLAASQRRSVTLFCGLGRSFPVGLI